MKSNILYKMIEGIRLISKKNYDHIKNKNDKIS